MKKIEKGSKLNTDKIAVLEELLNAMKQQVDDAQIKYDAAKKLSKEKPDNKSQESAAKEAKNKLQEAQKK